MHVGINVVSQNTDGKRSDHEIVRDQLRLADLVADLGFDSIWGTEHHFTGYMLAPDVLQYLTYVAGKYPHLQVGSQVVVLPWHNPMRVAEQVSLLDNFCEGRLILGIGRGAARVEFETFGYDMSESRERFVEYADMLIQGLERGYCEYDGKHLKQKRAEIRPHPYKSFKGRTYAAAVSPDSAPIMAKLGAGLLVIPQKPWDQVADDLELHRRAFREIHGVAAPAPVCGGFVYCHAKPERAREDVYQYQVAYWQQVVTHYEYGGSHFGKTKGYEGYQAWANNIQEQGTNAFAEAFVGLQPWGTPDEIWDKILKIRKQIGFDIWAPTLWYGGMPLEDAERSLKLFAREVVPALKKLPPAGTESTAAPRAAAR